MEIRIYTGQENAVGCSICHISLIHGDKYVDVQREYLICEACITESYNKINEIKEEQRIKSDSEHGDVFELTYVNPTNEKIIDYYNSVLRKLNEQELIKFNQYSMPYEGTYTFCMKKINYEIEILGATLKLIDGFPQITSYSRIKYKTSGDA